MDIGSEVWLVLPLLGIVVAAVLMTRRKGAHSKKGIVVGAIIGGTILGLYYIIRNYLMG